MTKEEAIERFNEIKNAMSISIAQSKFYPSKAELDKLCDMAIEALSADAIQGEWIFNPKDAIELMFTKPKCSECGFESSDGGNFCPNCGAKMKGGEEK